MGLEDGCTEIKDEEDGGDMDGVDDV